MSMKPKFVLAGARVTGKVIERTLNGKYHENRYSKANPTLPRVERAGSLSEDQRRVVCSQPTFHKRIRKLLSFFPDADYISENVVDALNYTNVDDIESELKNYIDFSSFHPVYD